MSDDSANIRTRLQEIALTDALNSRRMQDAIREALTASLLKKADTMKPKEILGIIKSMEALSKTSSYKEILDLLDK